MTKSLHTALADLKLQRAWVVCPGSDTYRIHANVEAIPLTEVVNVLPRLLR
jgi:hypothetical protein